MISLKYFKSLSNSVLRLHLNKSQPGFSKVSLMSIYTKGTNLDKKKYKKSELDYEIEALALEQADPELTEAQRAKKQEELKKLKDKASKGEAKRKLEETTKELGNVFVQLRGTDSDHLLEKYKSKHPVRVLFITKNASRSEQNVETKPSDPLNLMSLKEKVIKKLETRYPKEGVLELESRGHKLQSYEFSPEKGKLRKQPILMIHGFGQHSQIDAHLAAQLAAQGFQVFSYDWRGHGRSEGARFQIEKLEDVYEQAQHVLEQVLQKTSSERLIIHGFSLGGSIGLKLASERESQIKAVVACNPFLNLAKQEQQRGAGILSKVSSIFSKKQTLFLDNAEIQKFVKFDPHLLTQDPDKQTIAQLHRSQSYFQGLESELKVPFLLVVGQADRVADVKTTRQFFKRATGVEDKQILEYREVGHLGYLDELNGQQMAQNVISFCMEQGTKTEEF